MQCHDICRNSWRGLINCWRRKYCNYMRFSIVSGGICIYSCSLASVPGSVPSCLEYPSTTLTCSGMSGASTENATKSWCSGVETDKTTHNLIPAECWLDSIAISRIFSSSAVSTHHKWDGGGQHALDMLMITSLVPRRRSSDERSCLSGADEDSKRKLW